MINSRRHDDGLRRLSASRDSCQASDGSISPTPMESQSFQATSTLTRGLKVADFVNAVMRAIWAEDQNVADPGVLVIIAERCGLEGRGLLAAADAEAVRAEYRGNT